MKSPRTALAGAAACACAVVSPAPLDGAITLADIDNWIGSAPGQGVSQAVLVIDFGYGGAPPGAPSLAWGFRWLTAEPRTGRDMVAAVVAADPRLTVTGLEFGFVDTIGYDANLDGTIDFRHPGFDPASGRYSVYWVNNAVIVGTPPLFSDAAHVLPPNGNPYADKSPGTWVVSTTGLAGRPLADGSWDGWVFAADPAAPPREPVAAIVPEPSVTLLVAAAACWGWRRRWSKPSGNPMKIQPPCAAT
ncbi:MAG: hypothetical protein ACKV19_06010 [Verrucomicrobiales bacterium]